MKILNMATHRIKKLLKRGVEGEVEMRKSIQYLGMTIHKATFDDFYHTIRLNGNTYSELNNIVLFASRFQDNDSQKQYMTTFPYCMNEEVIQKVDFSMGTIEALKLMATFDRLDGKRVGKNMILKKSPMCDLEMIRDFHPSGPSIVDNLEIKHEDIGMGEFALHDLFVCNPDPELVVEADINNAGELLYDVCDCFTFIGSIINKHHIDLLRAKGGDGSKAGNRILDNPLLFSSFGAKMAMKSDFLESIR